MNSDHSEKLQGIKNDNITIDLENSDDQISTKIDENEKIEQKVTKVKI